MDLQSHEPRSARAASPAGSPPWVGRRNELEQFEHWLDDTRRQGEVVAFLEGPTGIGKTRLLREMGQRAQERGFQVLWGSAFEGGLSPYRPLREALAAVAPGPSSPATAAPSPPRPGPAPSGRRRGSASQGPAIPLPPGPPDDQVNAETASARFTSRLEELLRDRPVALLLDDLPCADEGTVRVLGTLTRHLRTKPLLLVSTMSGTTRLLAEEARGTPTVRQLVHALRNDTAARVLELAPLTEEETRELAARHLGTPASEIDASFGAFLRRSGGNPLLLLEMLDRGTREGWIVRASGAWSAGPAGGDPAEPESLTKGFKSRLASLAPHERAAIEAASILEEPFETEEVAAVLGEEADDLAGTLKALSLPRGGLQRTESGAWKFEHRAFAQVARESVPAARRRELHRRAADHVRSQLSDQVDQVAWHLYQAGDAEEALAWLAEAWERAQTRGSGEAMVRVARHAREMLRRGSASFTEEAEWLHREAEGWRRSGDVRQARELLDLSLQHTPRGPERIRVLCTLAQVEADRGEVAAAEERLEEADREPAAAEDEGLVDGLRSATRLGIWARAQAYPRILLEGPAMLERARGKAALRHLLMMYRTLAFAEMSRGEFAMARRYLLDAQERAREEPESNLGPLLDTDLGGIALMTGDLPWAERAFRRAIEWMHTNGRVSGESLALGNLGEVLLGEGRYSEAEASLRAGLEMADRGGLVHPHVIFLPILARCLIENGRAEEGEALLLEYENDIPLAGNPDSQRLFHALRLQQAVRGGRWEEAEKLAQKIGSDLSGQFGCFALRAVADLWDRRGRSAEAERLLEEIEKDARARGRKLQVALTLEAHGEMAGRRGDLERQRTLLREARAIYGSCGAEARASRLPDDPKPREKAPERGAAPPP